MMQQDMERLKKQLLTQRAEVFRQLRELDQDWQALSGHEIEVEEEAQKAALSELFGQLDEREQREIEEIDLALSKMAAASYGICEGCRRPIPPDRLAALPAARYCRDCAARQEEKMRMPPTVP